MLKDNEENTEPPFINYDDFGDGIPEWAPKEEHATIGLLRPVNKNAEITENDIRAEQKAPLRIKKGYLYFQCAPEKTKNIEWKWELNEQGRKIRSIK
ncbi:MAG: hypothetical protein AAFP92_18380 [Bacteroidota bacterium]